MLELKKFESVLSNREFEILKIVNDQCSELEDQQRPNFSIKSIIGAGNRWGECRIFSYLERELNGKEGLICTEGQVGKIDMRRKLQEAAPDLTLLTELFSDRNTVLKTIRDTEKEGQEPYTGGNTLEYSETHLAAVAAYSIYNDKVKFYGIDRTDLFEVQAKLTRDGSIDDYFYEVGRLRSEVIFNNIIKIMDNENMQTAYAYIAGFHNETFEKLSKIRKIKYSKIFVHDLPKSS